MGFDMFGGQKNETPPVLLPVTGATETSNEPRITMKNFSSLDYTDPVVKASFDNFLTTTKTGGLFSVIEGFGVEDGDQVKAGRDIPDFPIKDTIIQVAKNLTHKYYHLLNGRLKDAVYGSIYESNGGQDLDDDDEKIKNIMDKFDSLEDDKVGFNNYLESTFANFSEEVLIAYNEELFNFYNRFRLDD
jgi:hypothetical protein